MRPIPIRFMTLIISMAASQARPEWTAMQIPAGENPRSLWFTDATTGFMVGASVWKTVDGAATWEKKEIPPGNYHEIRFRDALTGFVAGTGALLKTTDGGNQWQPVGAIPATFLKLSLSGDAVYGCTSGGRRIWKSANGGSTWDTLGDMGTTAGNLAFPDSQTGFVSSQKDVYKSSNGGKQWRKVYTIRMGGAITDMQFLNPDTGYVSAYYPGSVSSTFDGGETWREVPSNFWLYGLHFSDSRHGCVLGTSSMIMRTTDAGATWVSEGTGGPVAAFKDLYFPTADVGYVLTGASVLKFSNPPVPIRPAGPMPDPAPASRGFFDHQFDRHFDRHFDIRGVQLPAGRPAPVWRTGTGPSPTMRKTSEQKQDQP